MATHKITPAPKPLTQCLVCKGKGHQTIIASILIRGHLEQQAPVDVKCLWCTDGEMTPLQVEQYRAYTTTWCRCGNPSGQTVFYDDGENPLCEKHCWCCSDCGRLVQVG